MSTTRTLATVAALALPLSLAACGGGGDGGDGGDGTAGTAAGETRTLRFAHSYTDTQPQSECGAKVIQEELANADVGLEVEIFGSSQLGGDADRISAVVAGDIDMDMQGASALGAVYEPIGIIDGAYVFEEGQQLSDFIAGEDSQEMRDAFHEASGVTVLGAWSAGARQFTANKAIRTPEDLKGLRMRFPNSEQYLMNAAAMGAEATEVAYEELYLALQQGTVDGQENPIVNIQALSLHEVQDYLSMSSHQLNSNLIIVGPVWDELTDEQKSALQDAVSTAVGQVPNCVEEAEQAALDEWRSNGDMEIVEDVDVDAFRTKAKTYFEQNLEGDKLKLYQAIQNSIGG